MATADYYEVLENNIGKVFTLGEAVQFMKMMDRFPTMIQINWVSTRTGRPVSIGYTGSPFD